MDDRRRMDDRRTPEHGYTISSPGEPKGSGELKMVDGRTDDGRTMDGRQLDGYTISSPCEPNGSGELKSIETFFLKKFYMAWVSEIF